MLTGSYTRIIKLVLSAVLIMSGVVSAQPTRNQQAVDEVLAGLRTEANVAWWGFDPIDSTRHVQAAIDSGASRVIIPNVGQEWVVRPITLRSNLELVFEEGVVVAAKKGDYHGRHDSVFAAREVENLTLRGYGATIRMHKEDYAAFPYTKSEHRMGVAIRGGKNIQILGLTIRDTGGDGIYVGSGDRGVTEDMIIRDVVADNNYRQGISVISARNLLIENSVFKNTGGTLPMAGIDFEPNNPNEVLENIVVRNTVFDNNEVYGITVNLKRLDADANVSILMENVLVRGSSSGINIKGNPGTHPSGEIVVRNCVVENIGGNGLRVEHLDQDTITIAIEDCVFHNVANRTTPPNNPDHPHTAVPMFLEGPNRIGNVKFNNVIVTDMMDRPTLYVGVGRTVDGEAFSRIRGELQIISPFGSNVRWGRRTPTDEAVNGIRLQVTEIQDTIVHYDQVVSLPDYALSPVEITALSIEPMEWSDVPQEPEAVVIEEEDPGPQNYVTNPGFEAISGDAALHWSAQGGWGNAATVTPEAARTGVYGVQLATEEERGYFVSHSARNIEGGKTYEFSAWVRSSTGNQGRMKAEIYGASGHLTETRNLYFDPSEDWTQISTQFDVPPEATRITVLLRISGPGVVHYDDVELYVVE